jgi:hypothetical protein
MTYSNFEDDLVVVRDLGTKAARARYQHDEATSKSHTDYMLRFCSARPTVKAELRQAFSEAYRAESEAHFNSLKSTIRW